MIIVIHVLIIVIMVIVVMAIVIITVIIVNIIVIVIIVILTIGGCGLVGTSAVAGRPWINVSRQLPSRSGTAAEVSPQAKDANDGDANDGDDGEHTGHTWVTPGLQSICVTRIASFGGQPWKFL